MSVDRPESHLTNLDFQMTVNNDGVSVSYGGAAADREAEQAFVREVAYKSGAAMAETVNTRQGSAVIDPNLLQERRGMTLGEEVQFTIPAPVEHDPLIIAAKEITKPAADIAPVVIGKEPAQRGFDLPPQHIIDAKTITVHETPIAPEGTLLEPIERKMIRLESGVTLPMPDELVENQEEFEHLVKGFIVPQSQIEARCQAEFSRSTELFDLVLEEYGNLLESYQSGRGYVEAPVLLEFYLNELDRAKRFLGDVCVPYLDENQLHEIVSMNLYTAFIMDEIGMEVDQDVLDVIRDALNDIPGIVRRFLDAGGRIPLPIPPIDLTNIFNLFRNRH